MLVRIANRTLIRLLLWKQSDLGLHCLFRLVWQASSVGNFRIFTIPVILLPAHPASFVHNFVSGMQSFYFIKSQDAIVLQTCH